MTNEEENEARWSERLFVRQKRFEAVQERFESVPAQAISDFMDDKISLHDLWTLNLQCRSGVLGREYESGLW